MPGPLIDITADGHIHTSLCHHAVGSMEEYVRAAVRKGLKKIFFLEHLEIGINYFESTWLTEEDFEKYFEEGLRLQKTFHDEISIGLGVEVGYNPRKVSEILEFLVRYQLDRIGVSYHFFEIDGRHYNVVSRKRENMEAFSDYGIDRLMTSYYDGLLTAAEKLPADVLCHLDAVLRHHSEANFKNSHWDQVQKIFRVMAEKNIALEVNTSGYRHRGEPYPAPVLIAGALQHGITLAAGSDAHRPQDVGRYFDRLLEDLPDYTGVLS